MIIIINANFIIILTQYKLKNNNYIVEQEVAQRFVASIIIGMETYVQV